jgi:RNA polymerase sigma-70 factor (ECF subfamily)
VVAERKNDRKKEFEEIALPFMHALYSAALRLSKVREDAEGLVQETYLLAYKNFDSFQRGTNCKAWLFKILRNVFINTYRKKIKSPETVHYEEIENYYFYNKITSHQDSLAFDFHREPGRLEEVIGEDVGAALQGLPDEFKEVVILSDIEGFTYEEISHITDAPLGTVKSRLNRARRMLQKKLWDYAVKKGFIER